MKKQIYHMIQSQIKNGTISPSQKEVYEYGYLLLFEKVSAAVLALLIAGIFHAYIEVLLFHVAFVPVRIYAGGYHAKSRVGCMILSAVVLLGNILVKRSLTGNEVTAWGFLLEIPLFFLLYHFSPTETKSRMIEEQESVYFRKKIRNIYFLEIAAEIILLMTGYGEWVISFVTAHITICLSVLYQRFITKC